MTARRTIDSSNNPAVLGGVTAKNNGRYNGNGRHWETPPEIFAPLDEEFNFTLDPCATHETTKCPEFFTEAQNGLEQSWAGHRVFMNPPYGREVYAWTRKARLEQAAGVLVVGLLPASTDLAWWHEDVIEHAEVRYLRGRVRFLTDGPYRASGFFASVITIWRPALFNVFEISGYRMNERCPSCFGTEADYALGAYRCSNPWHADDHLRAKTLARQTTTSVLPLCEGQAEECDGGSHSSPVTRPQHSTPEK